ncbi:uncharacterized protein LOC130797185 [Amaranthus tricolor]|uniref:uncharacterized protein LOC130797185 n=1 Tax=Amaranthus tricolor TaxID=29722 RepID=UPI002586A063|nr:uncharacterized protein LOC130797185 [Amaranthus tricolor]
MGDIRISSKFNPNISCFKGVSLLLLCANPRIKLISHEGTTKILKGRTRIKAGEIMFKFPDCVVCHADSFFLGRPIPVLAIHDYLVAGRTYFVLPLDRIPQGSGTLSAASLQSLSSPSPINNNISCPSFILSNNNSNNYCKLFSGGNNESGNQSPFEYIKDKEGRVLMIKVVPDFITKIITPNNNDNNSPNYNSLCTTPELKKEYEQLVRAKDQTWSPNLETISEVKIRSSPTSKLLRLKWIQTKQKQVYFDN